jgi:hypothetical protein
MIVSIHDPTYAVSVLGIVVYAVKNFTAVYWTVLKFQDFFEGV